jgi:hypothetical protein
MASLRVTNLFTPSFPAGMLITRYHSFLMMSLTFR